MKMNRFDLGIIVRYTTGHAHLRRHNKIANTPQECFYDLPEMKYNLVDPDDESGPGIDRDQVCRLCKIKSKAETPHHMATECLRIWRTRWDKLGYPCFANDDSFNWKAGQLLEFFKHFDLENKPNTL